MQNTTFEQVTTIKLPVNSVSAIEIARKRQELEREMAELAVQEEKERQVINAPVILELKRIISQCGIIASDLFGASQPTEPRYRYLDMESGETKTWNGRGTKPKWLDGRENDCLIPGEEHTKAIAEILAARTGEEGKRASVPHGSASTKQEGKVVFNDPSAGVSIDVASAIGADAIQEAKAVEANTVREIDPSQPAVPVSFGVEPVSIRVPIATSSYGYAAGGPAQVSFGSTKIVGSDIAHAA